MTVNPFEPPRTTDLEDAGPAAPEELRVVPEGAIRELLLSSSSVRWTARLATASLVLSTLHGLLSLDGRRTGSARAGVLLSIVIGVPLNLLAIYLYRQYGNELERLKRGEQDALQEVIAGQGRIFKVFGLVLAIGIGLIVVGTMASVVVGIATAGVGR